VSPFYWSIRTLKTPNPCDTWHVLVTPRVLPYGLPRHRYGLPRQHCTVCHVSTVRTVRTGTVSKSKFCLFGSADRMRYLPHTDSVCDKNYTAGIRKTSRTSWCWFRRNPSTFIFEHFSCPDRLLDPISDHTSPQ
jgi:hypothetical protein